MKLVIIVWKFPPKWIAGTELASYNLAKYMGKNHHVSVITSYDAGISDQSNIEGFDVYRVSSPGIKFFGILLFWIKVFLTIKQLKPEIIQVQGLHMSVPAVLAKKILNIPYVLSGRGGDVYDSWTFKGVSSKLGQHNALVSVALTEYMKNEMQKNSDKRIEVVPNGIDTKKFNLDKYESREKLNLDREQKIILFVGRLELVKGLKYLIESIVILKCTEKNMKLLLVGDGSEVNNLKLLVKKLQLEDDVIFIGKRPTEKIPEYLIAADVFVLPSLSEGFPNVLLEAMAAGLPIVTTKIGGLAEIVEEGVNGFLVDPKSPVELADKIALILNNENLAKKISNENKERSYFYDWKNIASRLEILYNL